MKALLAGALVTLGIITFAGCSSDDDSSSSTTTTPSEGKAGVCAARDELQESLQSLADPSLLIAGKSEVQSSLNDVQDELDKFGDAAESDYQPQVEAVQSSIDELKSAVSDLGEGSVTSNIEDLGSAIAEVGRATEPLLEKIRADCP